MNIFILCAGKGTRFESIYPKPLNLINGKPMIYHTIKSLNLEKVQDYNLYIIYNKKLENCNFKQILINMFPSIKFNFILLDYFTRGASESAYIGLNQIYNDLLLCKILVKYAPP
jgi:dTDP-glucose pyrophosphorylase